MRMQCYKFISLVILFCLPLFGCVGSDGIDVYFSPKGGAESALLHNIGKARKSIDICIYTFTNKKIANALVLANKRGIRVRVIFDRRQAAGKYSVDEYLSQLGVTVIYDTKHHIQHNKYAIIDSCILITGSYNLTISAEIRNAENMIVIRNNRVIKRFVADFKRHIKHSGRVPRESE